MPAPSASLHQLLRNLNTDPALVARLQADPDAVVAQAGLQGSEADAMRSPDRYRLLQSLHGDAQAQPQK